MDSVRELRSYERSLPVDLTDSEVLAFGRELASKPHEFEEEEERLKAAQAAAKLVKDELKARMAYCKECVRTRTEERLVKCRDFEDEHKPEAISVRLDTGEEFNRRALTEAERQRDIAGTRSESSVH